ncbi:TPA: hypothetical protein QCJ61_003795 [Enterobacter asburiae]|nr:hypothetical protein [Enterobacter asburiae]HDR2805763.1 hypothetical protein [Enterobacter asburiae]HDR2811333.1 hypothetical protein [Enterobacter asburiae]HDR2816770.1 hypothetical protein [Enterobacter asburiae]
MPYKLFTLICEAARVALYSFIFGPALVMYVFVMLAVSNGSLSLQFLTAYHGLTDGLPAGKVMGCVNEHEMAGRFSLPEPGEKLKPVSAYDKAPSEVLCQRVPVDSDLWARSTDATLRSIWNIGAMFGFGVWIFSRGLILASRKRSSPDMHSALVLQKKEKRE